MVRRPEGNEPVMMEYCLRNGSVSHPKAAREAPAWITQLVLAADQFIVRAFAG
jgi:hypothetical protein